MLDVEIARTSVTSVTSVTHSVARQGWSAEALRTIQRTIDMHSCISMNTMANIVRYVYGRTRQFEHHANIVRYVYGRTHQFERHCQYCTICVWANTPGKLNCPT